MPRRSKPAEFHEGPEAVWRAEHGLTQILKVSKEELARRESAAAEARSHKPKRGPKPGTPRRRKNARAINKSAKFS